MELYDNVVVFTFAEDSKAYQALSELKQAAACRCVTRSSSRATPPAPSACAMAPAMAAPAPTGWSLGSRDAAKRTPSFL